MGFFQKLLGKQDPLEQMRQFCSRENWAGAFTVARTIDPTVFSEEERQEIASIEQRAGDHLARLNLEEGEGEMRNGNLARAREHCQLAREQARTPVLQQQAESLQARLDRGNLESARDLAMPPAAAACGPGCGPSCSPHEEKSEVWDADGLDDEARFEVLLATLPESLAARYMSAGNAFRKAWLASHDDDPAHALELLAEVPENEQDALFYSERGNLKGRNEDFAGGLADLQKALADEPDLFVAFHSLVEMLTGCGRLEEMEKLLHQALAADRFPGYCQANLAQLLARRGEDDEALRLGSAALQSGYVEQGTVVLCASLLEKKGRFDEAEALLLKLQGGGCAGGAHPLLAEFWLRRNKCLDKALEAFKGALRQEQGNPRWRLRIAQVYLARGWHNEAAEHLDRLLGQDGLVDDFRREVQLTADQLRNS